MEFQLITAAASGAITSALRFIRQSKFKTFRIALAGFLLSYFTAIDFTDWFNKEFEQTISYEPVFFILGYLGAALLEQAIQIINAYTVKAKWK